jgi:hypothetical protein
MSILNTGNVGIGTTSPYELFSVSGRAVITATTTIGTSSTAQQAGLKIGFGGLCVDNDGTCTASTTGRISAVDYTTGASDIAENYYSEEALEPGDIVQISNLKSQISNMPMIEKADNANSIIGVISTKPGIILGLENDYPAENHYPVALTGKVPVKVNLEGGEIKIGDPITVSSVAGEGMKATTTCRIIGYALENYGANNNGKVLVFLNLSWYFSEDVLAKISSQPSEVASGQNIFDSLLGWFKDKIVQAKEFIAEKITAKKVVTDAIEMKDSVTGEIYCVRIANGEWEKFKGTCGESSQSSVASSQPSVSAPATTEATTTPSVLETTTPESTPEVPSEIMSTPESTPEQSSN